MKNIFYHGQEGVQGYSPDRIALGKVVQTVTMQSCTRRPRANIFFTEFKFHFVKVLFLKNNF